MKIILYTDSYFFSLCCIIKLSDFEYAKERAVSLHYLDNAATTRPCAEAVQTANEVLALHYANPSSLYAQGAKSEAVLTAARETLAKALGCKASEVVFTASGSEGNNIAILGAAKTRCHWGKHIVATAYEHPSVQNTVAALEKDGFSVTLIAPGKDGLVPMDAIVNAVTDKTVLVTAMHVNNETGAYLDVAALARAVKAKNSRTAVHIDGVQAFCKLKLALGEGGIDSYAVSGHKIHAPKGVGALDLRRGYHITPVLFGGGQEGGMRPGTENVAYCAAFAAACARGQQALSANAAQINHLVTMLWQGLADLPGITRNSPESAVCGIANFSCENIKSETMLHFLEQRGIYVSSGSACSKGEASHTLTAMHLPKSRIDTALRVSFAAENTVADVDALCAAVREGIASLAKMRR